MDAVEAETEAEKQDLRCKFKLFNNCYSEGIDIGTIILERDG